MRAPLSAALLLGGLLLGGLFIGGLASSPALAQGGAPSLPMPTLVTPGSPGVPLSQDVQLKRWPDGDVVVAELTAGTPVVPIVAEGELTRVRHELDFGWIPTAALSSSEAGAEDAGAEDAAAE